MEKLKKALRLMLLICLIVLATVGIGLTGVAPPQRKSRARNKKIKTEQLESKKEVKDVFN